MCTLKDIKVWQWINNEETNYMSNLKKDLLKNEKFKGTEMIKNCSLLWFSFVNMNIWIQIKNNILDENKNPIIHKSTASIKWDTANCTGKTRKRELSQQIVHLSKNSQCAADFPLFSPKYAN